MLQVPGKLGFPGIGTGDGKMLMFEYFSKTAHADAADTDKMDMYRVLKIDFIHSLITCLLIEFQFIRICMIYYTRILMICKFFWRKIFSTCYVHGLSIGKYLYKMSKKIINFKDYCEK